MNLMIVQQISNIKQKLESEFTSEQFADLVAISIARAISLDLPLPSGEVHSIDMHFAGAPGAQAAEVISAINENFIVDVQKVMTLTRQFYAMRYKLVFSPKELSRALSFVAANDPDTLPGYVVESLAKYNTPQVNDAFDALIWGFKEDFSRNRKQLLGEPPVTQTVS